MANSNINNTACAGARDSMPANVPTDLAYVALPNYANFSGILSHCNNDSAVAEWGDNNCYIYTNVTAEGQTHEHVASCVKATLRRQNMTYGIMLQDDAKGAAGRLEMGGVAGKVVLIVAVLGAIMGGL